MVEHGTWYVPTIIAGDFVARQSKVPGYYPPQVAAKAAAIGPLILATAGRAYKAHVKIAFGTDAAVYPHGQNAHEFELMVEAGMPPMFTIQAATINAAQLLKRDQDLGSLAAGKLADVVAVPGDPIGGHQPHEVGELRDEGRGRLQAEFAARAAASLRRLARRRAAPPRDPSARLRSVAHEAAAQGARPVGLAALLGELRHGFPVVGHGDKVGDPSSRALLDERVARVRGTQLDGVRNRVVAEVGLDAHAARIDDDLSPGKIGHARYVGVAAQNQRRLAGLDALHDAGQRRRNQLPVANVLEEALDIAGGRGMAQVRPSNREGLRQRRKSNTCPFVALPSPLRCVLRCNPQLSGRRAESQPFKP